MAFSHRHVILLYTRHVQNIYSRAGLRRVGAQHNHLPPGDELIKFLLVSAKFIPKIAPRPERIAADPDPLISVGQCAAELFAPTADNSLQRQSIVFEVPIVAAKDLELPGGKMLVEPGNGTAQIILCSSHRQRARDRPN